MTSNADFENALRALQTGNLSESERLFEIVLHAQPKHVEALNLLGAILGRLGRHAEAVARFDRALVMAPDSVEAWYGRGMTLLSMNRARQAIKCFERVIAIQPDFSQVHLLRAKLLVDLGRHEDSNGGVGDWCALTDATTWQ